MLDILDAIEAIERHAQRGRDAFDSDELIQIWVVHHLQIIGEACRAVSDEVKQAHAAVPWRQISAMRNLLVHMYWGVDKEAVWNVVVSHLPDLRSGVDAILRSLPVSDP